MNHSNGFSNGRPLSSPSIFSSESASPTSPIESGCCRYPRSKSVNSLFYKSDKGTNSIKRLPKFTWAIFKGRDKSKKSKEPKNDHGLKRHPVKKVTSWQFVQPETEIDIPVSDRPSMKGNTLERIEFDTRTVLSEQRMQTFTIVPTKLTPSPALRTQPSSKTPTPTKSLRRQVLNKDSNKKHSPIMIKNVPRSPGPLDGSLYTQVKKRRPGETDDSDASNSSLSLNKGYTSHDEIPTTSALSLTIENDQDDLQYSGYSDDSTRSSPSDEAPSFMTSQTHEYEELIQDAEASMASSKYTVNDITIGLKEDETTSSVMTSDLNQEHAEETTNLYTRPEINHNYDVIQGQDDKPENLSISNDDVAYSNDVIASLPGQGKVANIESSADKERDNLDSVEVSPLYVATERMPDCDSTSVNVNVNEPTTMTSQVSAANMLQPSPSNHLTQLDVDNAMALVNECLADTEERGYCDNNANINDFNGNLEPPEFSPIQPDYPALEIDTRFEEKGPEYALPVRDVVLGTIPARKALLVSNTSSQKFIMNQADLENNNNPTDLKNSKINDPNLDGNGYSTIEDINTISSPASKQSLNVSGGGNSDGDSGIDGTTMVHTTSISDVNTPDAASSVSSLNQNKTEPEVKQVFLHIPQKAAEVDIITIKNVVHESSDSLPQPQSTQSSPSLSSPTLTNTSEKMEEEQGGEEQDEDEEERRMREEIENTRKKLLDLESKHNTLRRRKEETKRHSLGYKIAQTNDSMDILLPSPNHVISATLPRSTGVHHSQPDPKPPTSHLSDKEQQEIDELLRSVQDLDIMTSQRADDAITAIEQQSFPTSESVTMATTALTADPVALQNNSYSRYHDANRGSSVGVFTPAYAHPMHQPQHMERENLHTQLQLQKQEENARMQQKEELERQRRSLEYEQQKLLQEQRQREYNRHKELEQERRNQYESHLLVQKQQEREFLIQESKRQAEREKQEKFQLAFDQKQRVLQEQQKYVTQPPPAPHVDRFPKAEIEQKAMQLEVQRRTSLSMEALEARVAVASQPQLVTPQALGQTSQPVKSDDLQLQLDELDKYIQQLTQPTAEPLTDKSEPVAASVAAIPPKRNSEVVRRNRRSFTVDLERKLDPNIPLSPEDLVNTSMFAKDEPPRPPSRTKSSYNSVRRHSHGFDLAQMIQIDINPEVQRHADKNDDVFSPLTSPNPSYPPQSSKTRPLQQKVPNVGYTPPPATQPTPPPKKSVSLEERLSPQLFLAMTVNPGARPVENVHSYKEDQVEEQRVDEVDSAPPPPQTPGFPVSPKTPYVNLSSPEPNHVPIGFTKTPLSALGLKPNERPQRAIDDVSSSDSDVTGNNTQDRSPLGSDTRRSIQNTSNNHAGSPLNTTATNGYDPKLGIKETNLLPTSQTSRLEEQQQTSIHQAYSAQPQENFHGYNSQPQSYPNNNNPQFQQQHRQQNGWHGNNNKSPWIHPTNGHSPLLTPTSGKSFSTPGPTSSLGSGGVSPSGSRSLTGSNDSLLSDGSGGSHNNSSTGGGYPKRHPSLPPKESSIRNSGSSLRSTSTAGSGYLGGASQTSPQSAGSAGSPSSTTGHYPFTQPPINRRESQLSAYERHGSMHNNLSSDDGGLNSPASGRTSTSSISDIDKLAQELSMSSLSGAAPPKFIRDTTSYWYKPDITREQALAMLRDRSAGSFVVRNSRCYPGAFGLALKVDQVPQAVLATAKPGTNMSDELVRHFLIEPSTRGVKLKGCANEPVFGSLSALIYQHSITPLALPCKLIISAENQKVPQLSGSSRNSAEVSNSAAELLRQGAACNVLYLGSADTESLTGPEAIERAMRERMQNKGQAIKTSVVHFKVSPQGITLTDNARKIFFRRHYPTSSVTYCGLDPSAREPHNRRWDASGDRGPPNARVFAFVAKKTSNSAVNVCHLFAELDLDQPAPAIVNFVSKVLIGNSARK